jgi:Conjugative transposon protein TcpC
MDGAREMYAAAAAGDAPRMHRACAEMHGVPDVPQTRAYARATVGSKPLWRIRLGRELPRMLLLGTAFAGLMASARYALAPPRPTALAQPRPAEGPSRDLAAEGFAQLFARRYLTWAAGDPEAHERSLAPYIGASMEPGAGLQPPAGGEERVQWTDVVQERTVHAPAGRVYTVAAQTDTAGLVYLTVGVTRARGGALELAGYPAFVGAPATGSGSAAAGGALREISDPALQTVIERALRNYLADSAAELAADLTSAARVSLPAQALSLEALQRLDWAPDGGAAVSATVQAKDARGARYTLAYELDIAQVAGRWEIAAIQMDPYT